jgi:hypothetical protein
VKPVVRIHITVLDLHVFGLEPVVVIPISIDVWLLQLARCQGGSSSSHPWNLTGAATWFVAGITFSVFDVRAAAFVSDLVCPARGGIENENNHTIWPQKSKYPLFVCPTWLPGTLGDSAGPCPLDCNPHCV